MAVILSLICTMSNLDNPESVGLRVAAAMSGVFVAMLLSQGYLFICGTAFLRILPGRMLEI